MHDVLGGYAGRGEVPGLVALVSRRGEVYVDAIGVRTAGSNEAVRRNSIFRIASMTKPITAAATMMLERRASSGWTSQSTRSCPSCPAVGS
jgi:CubicO group peptidase (beta-lactamase class C family)